MKNSECCYFFHGVFNSLRRYRFNPQDIDALDYTGVYIIFEKGELAHDKLDRIVRVGTTTGKKSVLKDRLYEHYNNEGRSVFRNNIAVSLLKKNGDPLCLSGLFYRSDNEKYRIGSKIEREKWKRNVANDAELCEYERINNEVSKYIRENCSFAILPAKRDICTLWEGYLLKTISSCNVCKQSDNWLGNYIPKERKKIRESGLWNIKHVKDRDIIIDEDYTH